MDTSTWPKMPEQERKRKLFTINFLETGSDTDAAAFSGLSPRHTRQRIADHLKKYGTLAEAPHPKESPKYTEEVMKAALAYFDEDPEHHFATPELVSYLKREGFLEAPVDEQNFRHHFDEWLRTKGLSLRVACRKMIFAIPAGHKATRLKWVR